MLQPSRLAPIEIAPDRRSLTGCSEVDVGELVPHGFEQRLQVCVLRQLVELDFAAVRRKSANDPPLPHAE